MWYNRVVQDIGNIPDFIAYYEAELATARTECHIRGSVEKSISQLLRRYRLRISQRPYYLILCYSFRDTSESVFYVSYVVVC